MNQLATYPSLAGKSVFVSGGTSGIGRTLVEAFAHQGARVAFIGRNVDAGMSLVAGLAGRCPFEPLFMQCDVTDVDALKAAIARARTAHGPITVLINNAANDQRRRVEEVTPEFWDNAMHTNLRHQFFAAQAVVDDMKQAGGGSIINLGSTSWMIKAPDYPAYATCKAAIHGLTRSLARELGPHNIRANVLVPGWTMTDKQLRMWVDDEAEREIDRAQCLPGRVMPEHVASLALFMAADDSAMITAQSFVIDGGWT